MSVVFEITEGPETGRTFRFEEHEVFLVGRHPDCAYRIQDRWISRVHAIVDVCPPTCRVRDLGSKNGTFVNDRRVEEAQLSDGDRLRIGRTVMVFRVEAARIPEPEPAKSTFGEVVVGQDSDVPQPYQKRAERLILESDSAGLSGSEIECLRCRRRIIQGDAPIGNLPLCENCRSEISQCEDNEIVTRYRFIRQLGSGGMGKLWLAEDIRNKCRVVIKTIRPELCSQSSAVAMFERERQISLSLQHPNIVQFLAGWRLGDLLFLVMEYVNGIDTDKLLSQRGGRLPEREAVQIAIQTLEGLNYAHSQGVVHRDVKPANILVEGTPRKYFVKITDFGLARIVGAAGKSGITRQGDIRGTLAYMPPEQVLDCRNVDLRADIFGLGATLYHLLTGNIVYNLSHLKDPIRTIVEEEPVPIENRGVSLNRELVKVVNRSIRKRPQERFCSAEEMRRALEQLSL